MILRPKFTAILDEELRRIVGEGTEEGIPNIDTRYWPLDRSGVTQVLECADPRIRKLQSQEWVRPTKRREMPLQSSGQVLVRGFPTAIKEIK